MFLFYRIMLRVLRTPSSSLLKTPGLYVSTYIYACTSRMLKHRLITLCLRYFIYIHSYRVDRSVRYFFIA
jgi:hypothetical protein